MSTTNERPTPETDAKVKDGHRVPHRAFDEQDYPTCVPIDFARRLERERDEAVAYAERCKQGCISLSHAIDRIDYACGEPNEMGVSEYCVHQNDEAVVARVKGKLRKMIDLEEHVAKLKLERSELWVEIAAAKHGDSGHLRAIEAHLDRLLAIARHRTPGEWDASGSGGEVIGNNEYGFLAKEEVCCSPGRGQFWPENASYIVACSNNAERAWRSTKAAIADWLSLYNSTEGYADGAPDASAHDKLCNEVASICRINLRHILAEWPLETLKP